jgi:hypothetical protein
VALGEHLFWRSSHMASTSLSVKLGPMRVSYTGDQLAVQPRERRKPDVQVEIRRAALDEGLQQVEEVHAATIPADVPTQRENVHCRACTRFPHLEERRPRVIRLLIPLVAAVTLVLLVVWPCSSPDPDRRARRRSTTAAARRTRPTPWRPSGAADPGPTIDVSARAEPPVRARRRRRCADPDAGAEAGAGGRRQDPAGEPDEATRDHRPGSPTRSMRRPAYVPEGYTALEPLVDERRVAFDAAEERPRGRLRLRGGDRDQPGHPLHRTSSRRRRRSRSTTSCSWRCTGTTTASSSTASSTGSWPRPAIPRAPAPAGPATASATRSCPNCATTRPGMAIDGERRPGNERQPVLPHVRRPRPGWTAPIPSSAGSSRATTCSTPSRASTRSSRPPWRCSATTPHGPDAGHRPRREGTVGDALSAALGVTPVPGPGYEVAGVRVRSAAIGGQARPASSLTPTGWNASRSSRVPRG